MNSLKHALDGVLSGLKSEKNFRRMVICFVFLLAINSLLKISKIEWLLTIMCSGLVLGLELINSALEKTLDLYSLKNNSLIKTAKDLAAGAVLIISVTAVIIGFIIYFPYILKGLK